MAESSWPTLRDVTTSKTTGIADIKYSPKEVGSFSVDDKEEFIWDQSHMKYYVNPKQHLKFDLNEGIESYQRNDIRKYRNNLDRLLRWILQDPTTIDDVEFVVRRGTLVRLCETRFENLRGWSVRVQFFKGKYYISNYDIGDDSAISDEQWEAKKGRDYQAFKFEQISTSAKPDGVPDISAPVNNIPNYYRVLQARLSAGDRTNHNILFSAETDACTKNHDSVELTTFTTHRRHKPNWFTQKRWWLQSYISGTPTIVCGFLSADGILERVEEMNTKDIYTEWKRTMGKFPWHPVCFDFLANFLRAVKRVVTEEHPCAWFTFKAGSPVRYSWLKPDDHLLPDWYTSKMS